MNNTSTQSDCCNTAATETRRVVTPRYTVEETADAFVVTAFVPGAERTDIETTVDQDTLTLQARRSWKTPESWTPVHRETSSGDYRLQIELDRRTDREKIRAELSQGVLTLTLPKSEEVKPRKIEIKS